MTRLPADYVAQIRKIWTALADNCKKRDQLMNELRQQVDLILRGIEPQSVKHLLFDPKLVTYAHISESRLRKADWYHWLWKASTPLSKHGPRISKGAAWYNLAILKDGEEVPLWPPIAARVSPEEDQTDRNKDDAGTITDLPGPAPEAEHG